MNRKRIILHALLLLDWSALAAADWPRELSLPGGGFWRQRIEVVLENGMERAARGEPVDLVVGKGEGRIDLAGAAAEGVRVVDGKNRELLFRIQDLSGIHLDRGPIPEGSLLVIPAGCPPGEKVSCFVYFDNPAAWPLPDVLSTNPGVRNGGVEEGEGGAPAGWSHDGGDRDHRALWIAENPRGGRRCLKTVVSAGAPATWIATRQHGIHIAGGSEYLLEGWVKAEGVKGYAGWYIHVGNREEPMMFAPLLRAGSGTFGWKKVALKFTAPPLSTVADLGTVLRGTGTAWFDDVSLRSTSKSRLRAFPGRRERLDVRELGIDSPWYGVEGKTWDYRSPLRILNLSGDSPGPGLVSVDLTGITARFRERINWNSLRVVDGEKNLRYYRQGDSLLFEAGFPARTAGTCHLYFSTDRRIGPGEITGYADLLAGSRNLVKNPSFEDGDELPVGWSGGKSPERPSGTEMGLAGPGLFGKRCGRIVFPPGRQLAWTGWRQNVPVQPGRTYLLAAWLKCRDIQNGSVLLHAHIRDAAGNLCASGGMTSAGSPLSGSKDWTLLKGIFEMPGDAAIFQIHLTLHATGTVYHDGVLLIPVEQTGPGKVEARREERGISIWPVNPVVKVFREDLPPRDIPPARISAARNEREPLQLAIRSGTALPGLQVQVEPPEGPGGFRLAGAEIGVVGYVPIDHPSGYYQSRSEAWFRKVPSRPGKSDGWAGFWPDPILPGATLDLPARTTQPIWITLRIPANAPAGEYSGRVKLTSGEGRRGEVPFTVRAWDFTLPRKSHLKAIYDLRLGRQWSLPGKSEEEVRRQFLRFLAERRLCPDRIHPDPVLRYEKGRVHADFSLYDRAARYYLEELELPHTYTPGCFYLFGWGHPPGEKFGEKPYDGQYPYEGADRGKLRPAFQEAYQACLRAYWDHMKERGWEKRCVLYISDEPFYTQPEIREQMKALCRMIHEVDPEIPIYSSTWHHIPDWDGYLDIWGIGHHGTVSVEVMRKIRQAGDRIWFTTDGQMCTDTPLCAIERLLPHYSFHFGADAYEFWGISWLTYNPYRFGWHRYIHQSGKPGESYWIRYPNGDGFLAYPGGPAGREGPVTSIRLEQASEGMEDYEYLHLLRELVERAGARGQDGREGKKALEAASRLVQIPNAGGTRSTEILPDPDRLLQAREAVARAIEKLGSPRSPGL